MLHYTCHIDCRLRTIRPLKVTSSQERKSENNADSGIESESENFVEMIGRRPVMAIAFDDMEMTVQEPRVLPDKLSSKSAWDIDSNAPSLVTAWAFVCMSTWCPGLIWAVCRIKCLLRLSNAVQCINRNGQASRECSNVAQSPWVLCLRAFRWRSFLNLTCQMAQATGTSIAAEWIEHRMIVCPNSLANRLNAGNLDKDCPDLYDNTLYKRKGQTNAKATPQAVNSIRLDCRISI